MKSRQLGFLQILASGACFGLLGFFGKTAFQAGIRPGELLSLRFLISAIVLGLHSATRGQRPWQLEKKKIAICLLLGAAGYAVFSSLYFHALSGLSASLTVLLLYLYPVLVSVASHFFLKESLGRRGVAALVLSLCGLLALVWGEWQLSEARYLIFGLGSAFFYSLYILISGRVLAKVTPTVSTFYIQLGAGGVLALWSFQNFARPLSILQSHGTLILAMAVVCSLLAMTLFQAALQKLSAAETSILSTSEPFFSVLFAMLLLQERMTVVQVIGGAAIVGAMVILATQKGKA